MYYFVVKFTYYSNTYFKYKSYILFINKMFGVNLIVALTFQIKLVCEPILIESTQAMTRSHERTSHHVST